MGRNINLMEKCFNIIADAPLNSLMDSTTTSKVKTTKGKGVEAHSLACSTLKVKGRAETPGWD
jgi:hypothetical protein